MIGWWTKKLMAGVVVGLGLLVLTPGAAEARGLTDLLDTLRYTPRSQWSTEFSCHFGKRFFIVDLKTKRIVAACPQVWMNMRADEIKVWGHVTLLDAVYRRAPIKLRTPDGWQLFQPVYLEDKEMGVLVVLLKPVSSP